MIMVLSIVVMIMAIYVIALFIEKIIKLMDYKQDRNREKLKDRLFEAETELTANDALVKKEAAQFYRARTWEVIQNSKKGADFSEDEIRRLEEIGLSNYIHSEENLP